MGLADREYQREHYNPPRYTTRLIVVLLVAFLIQSIFDHYWGVEVAKWFKLSVDGLRKGYVWQLITFQFMHAVPGPWHVLSNCIVLYFFGRPMEERLGPKRFLSLYFLSGVMGGLLYVAVSSLADRAFAAQLGFYPSVVGASAGVCGILAIFCAMNPMHTIVLFFVLPVQARYVLWFVTAISVYGTIIPNGGVAHAAHLGGILFALAYVRWFHETDRLSRIFAMFARSRRLGPVRFPRAFPGDKPPAKTGRPRELGSTDFISKEVDPILEKISAHGIHSLTEREREILEAARSKMEKR